MIKYLSLMKQQSIIDEKYAGRWNRTENEMK